MATLKQDNKQHNNFGNIKTRQQNNTTTMKNTKTRQQTTQQLWQH